MSVLHRKVLREVFRQRGQALAVAAVVACGIAMFVTMRSAYVALIASQRAYYQGYQFADVFAHVSRAPQPVAERLRAIHGVAGVEPRLVFECNLDVPGLNEPATGRFVSLPQQVNRICLRAGRLPASRSAREVVVSEAFAQANQLAPGATLRAVLNGRWVPLTITGVAISPEYIYELLGLGVFPDNQRFGVLWMDPEALASIFHMTGGFNDVAILLAPGASEKVVIARLDAVLARYGSQGAYGREDQVSHRFISDEIQQDRLTGLLVPAIFLAIAAFLTNVVIARMVATQRTQIAVLKAFGYGNVRILSHYIELALVPVLGGTAIGIWGGTQLGAGLAALYAKYFRFPELRFEVGADLVLQSLAIATATAVAGAAFPVMNAARLAPAEAMQPPRPAAFRAGWAERWGLARHLPLTVRMILRNIERRPWRAALSVIGMGAGTAVLLVSHFFTDTIEYLMHFQFELVSRETATVMFRDALPASSRYELARLPGVRRVEGFRTVPVRLRAGHRTYRIAIQGVPAEGVLRRMVDRDGHRFALPPTGLVMTDRLAALLALRPGDRVTVEVLDGQRRTFDLKLAATVDELLSLAVYMDYESLRQELRESPHFSGAYLQADDAECARLFAVLKRRPAVGAVLVREAMIQSFRKTIAEGMAISTRLLAIFSVVIAFSIVYNSVRIALSERSHEFASLRVLGFTRGEIAWLLLGEQLLILVAATPVGMLMGYGLCAWLVSLMNTDLFRAPLVIAATSYWQTCSVMGVSGVLSAAIVLRGVWTLDLASALKTRE